MTTQPHAVYLPEMTIADRLHLARWMNGWDIKDFVAITGIGRDTVRHYEDRNWIRQRTDAYLELWATKTGFNLDWLLTGEGEPGGPGPALTLVAGRN
ncbi:MAG: hypothetical protein Q8L05_08150 [Actinomycetota bacterium]|nr:hypothetical protein [Actinomycetota bacterium]